MTLEVAATIDEVRGRVVSARRASKTIGFIPTMGALHEGHASLIRRARSDCGFVVVSIFVNPTQFGPNEDLDRYPRTPEDDRSLCLEAGADLIFAPRVETVYPPGFRTYVEVHELQDRLEGASRPGHFRGVATVVLKLFNIVSPDRTYFGQKDAQQVRVIQQMMHDLAVPIELVVVPTSREPDGLARSSRNRYLQPSQRLQAVVLSQALDAVRDRFAHGELRSEELRRLLLERVQNAPDAIVDYAEIVDADTLRPVQRIAGPVLVLLAVRFGSTRLIDNLLLPAPPGI